MLRFVGSSKSGCSKAIKYRGVPLVSLYFSGRFHPLWPTDYFLYKMFLELCVGYCKAALLHKNFGDLQKHWTRPFWLRSYQTVMYTSCKRSWSRVKLPMRIQPIITGWRFVQLATVSSSTPPLPRRSIPRGVREVPGASRVHDRQR